MDLTVVFCHQCFVQNVHREEKREYNEINIDHMNNDKTRQIESNYVYMSCRIINHFLSCCYINDVQRVINSIHF
jgi:hypothetical protein